MKKQSADVVVVMGSQSDLPVMKDAVDLLKTFKVKTEVQIVSAHRTPELLDESVEVWEKAGVSVIIAGAGGAAHLPGMLASYSVLPVIGVPVKGSAMNGLDSLLSIAQMPKGIPVATVGVNNSSNAALLALKILATAQTSAGFSLRKRLVAYQANLSKKVKQDRTLLKKIGVESFLKTTHK